MPQILPDRLTLNAQALTSRLGPEITEAIIRAATGVQRQSEAAIAGTVAGAEELAQGIGQEVAQSAQQLALPTVSARMAWRMGRFIGRIEGALKLALFGARLWLRQQSKRRSQSEVSGVPWRPLLQWGPSVAAILWMSGQLVSRRRRDQGPPPERAKASRRGGRRARQRVPARRVRA